MKITIVTPSFNQGKWIAQTIESIWSQEGAFSIEHLIMDGGSTDETVEVIKRYEAALPTWPVKCQGITFRWVSEKDRGQSDAINKGFKQATGDYIAWLNSDDIYEPGTIKKALDYLETNPDKIMVYGEGYYLYEPEGTRRRYPVEGPFNHERLAEICFITQPSVFLRREVLTEVGYVDESIHFCMDYDWWIRIGKVCEIGYLTEYLASTRIYPETKTESSRPEAVKEAVNTVLKHYGYLPDEWWQADMDIKLQKHFKRNTLPYMIIFESLFLLKKTAEMKRIPWNHLKRIIQRKSSL